MRLFLNMKYLLKKYEMSVTKLSKKSKVPTQTLHNWLSGVKPKDICQIKNVADVFGVSVDDLCFAEKLEGQALPNLLAPSSITKLGEIDDNE